MNKIKRTILMTGAFVGFTVHASAVSVVVDYSHSTNGFFDDGTADGALARATVEQAAADLSAAITSSLAAITNNSFTGTASGFQTTVTTNLRYTNPETGALETLVNPTLAADEFKIYVGARSIADPATLGQGGMSGVQIGYSYGGSSPSNWQAAADDATAQSNAAFSRGIPYTSLESSQSITDLGTTVTYDLSYGALAGNLWFDNDVTTNWNLDHNQLPGVGENDLYSVALHEMLHSLGIGLAVSWDDLVSGSDWLGSEVIALYGTGTGLIDGGHIAANVMSARLSDGVMQEVVMDPNLTSGTRKELTELDLAFLRDMGFETIPEPASAALLGMGGMLFLIRRRR